MFALLFALVSVVSVIALVRTVTTPMRSGPLDLAQWLLLAVTVVGATAALWRSLRHFASPSAPARSGSARAVGHDEAPRARAQMPSGLDDASWGALVCAVAVINALAAWAVLVTLLDLARDRESQIGWLVWQLALLTACLAGLTRFTVATLAEARDRTRRRRRNVMHVVTGKLVHWPERARGKRQSARATSVAVAAIAAGAAWANASGPLLDPQPRDALGATRDRGSRVAPPDGTERRDASAGNRTRRRRAAATDTQEAKRRRSPRRQGRAGSRSRSVAPVAPPAASFTPPAASGTSPTAPRPQARQPTRPKREGRHRPRSPGPRPSPAVPYAVARRDRTAVEHARAGARAGADARARVASRAVTAAVRP